jgi:hypothetical protein
MGNFQIRIKYAIRKILNIIGIYRIKVDGYAYISFKSSPLVSNGEPEYIELFKYKLNKSKNITNCK